MAISKGFFAIVLLALAFVLFVQGENEEFIGVGENKAGEKIDCGSECVRRCRLSSRPRLCHRACGTCCARCNCVPPGTAGNKELCPCYAKMTTHGNRLKCP
ncbi:gibberellin-regulated protein 1 [Andrographis paniculata]|uniref:gibberellin-regulated protein 1 n=1 Tax=Andrographis paniculata TaxID=175694 RepID=UPI0021E7462C|nr:gibberellin-regulated protein 1 [Andrographis paniculata]